MPDTYVEVYLHPDAAKFSDDGLIFEAHIVARDQFEPWGLSDDAAGKSINVGFDEIEVRDNFAGDLLFAMTRKHPKWDDFEDALLNQKRLWMSLTDFTEAAYWKAPARILEAAQ